MPSVDFFHHNWAAWGLYLLVGVIWFGIVEFITVRNKQAGDTLTETVQALHIPTAFFFMGGFALIGLLLWLVLHFPGKWGF